MHPESREKYAHRSTPQRTHRHPLPPHWCWHRSAVLSQNHFMFLSQSPQCSAVWGCTHTLSWRRWVSIANNHWTPGEATWSQPHLVGRWANWVFSSFSRLSPWGLAGPPQPLPRRGAHCAAGRDFLPAYFWEEAFVTFHILFCLIGSHNCAALQLSSFSHLSL